eukprot:786937-Rhodomonas_salina.2
MWSRCCQGRKLSARGMLCPVLRQIGGQVWMCTEEESEPLPGPEQVLGVRATPGTGTDLRA